MLYFDREFSEISRLIHEKKRILLATHQRPDGDAIGSMIGMFSTIAELPGKEVRMFSKDPVPENFRFLPHCDNIAQEISSGFFPDLFIGLDYGDFDRLGVQSSALENSIVVAFDHHPLNRQRGDILVIDPSLSSTCELIYNFIVHAGYYISSHTAEALLTGIFTDTGGFKHINTSVKTLSITANLLNRGVRIKSLYKNTFSDKPMSTLRTWGYVLENISCDREVGMCYAGITYSKFNELGASLDDFEGVVNIMDMPPDISFSLLLIEHKPEVIKGSMRSEPFKKGLGSESFTGVDVSRIAQYMGGGGHKYAAGFEAEGETLENVLKHVKKTARELSLVS